LFVGFQLIAVTAADWAVFAPATCAADQDCPAGSQYYKLHTQKSLQKSDILLQLDGNQIVFSLLLKVIGFSEPRSGV
jgi:hypothetical protein